MTCTGRACRGSSCPHTPSRTRVTNVVHDHTSALATIEAKWNLPALTYRDANASTVMDFLDLDQAAFLQPPAIAAPPVPVEATTTT
jgi:phospholipase C